MTSQFTLKRAEMQMSTPDPTVTTRQYCASGRERDAGLLYESGYKTRMKKKKKRYLIDVQLSIEKKLARPPDTAKLR